MPPEQPASLVQDVWVLKRRRASRDRSSPPFAVGKSMGKSRLSAFTFSPCIEPKHNDITIKKLAKAGMVQRGGIVGSLTFMQPEAALPSIGRPVHTRGSYTPQIFLQSFKFHKLPTQRSLTGSDPFDRKNL